MREVLREGTTLILVSHDLASIEATCTRGLMLQDGLLVQDGPIRPVLSAYRRAVEDYTSEAYAPPDAEVRLTGYEVAGPGGRPPQSHEHLDVVLRLRAERPSRGRLHLGVSEGAATPTLLVSAFLIFDDRDNTIRCRMYNLPLPRGRYSLWLHMEAPDDRDIIPWHPVGSFHLAGSDLDPAPLAVVRLSPAHVRSDWTRLEDPEAAAEPHHSA
jgi:hypothetical protein